MTFPLKPILVSALLFMSCNTGKLTVIGSIDKELDEASAIEIVSNSKLVWTIEDAGNKNNIYGLNEKGIIEKNIDISNIKNQDWEDLASDIEGNLYIGDFGNNSRKRKKFFIYKIENLAEVNDKTEAKLISFTLPEDIKSEDFEAFFLWKNSFYIFSKSYKKTKLLKVPNRIGNHVATIVAEYKLEGKDTRITSADISSDGKTVILLNHDKLWKLTNFKTDNFFEGIIKAKKFNHDSQKEGICFDKNRILITDERNNKSSNIYSFKLD